MLLWILRGLFGIIVIGMATGSLISLDRGTQETWGYNIGAFAVIMLVGALALAYAMVRVRVAAKG